MKKTILSLFLAATATMASAAVDTSEFITLELGKEYPVKEFQPFKGKITIPDNGTVIMYGVVDVCTLSNDELTELPTEFAGYINGLQAYQFAATAGTTYYLVKDFPMLSFNLRLEMNPEVKILSSIPAEGAVYDPAEQPFVELAFNQNVTIAEASVACGSLSEVVTTAVNGSNIAVNVNEVVNKWFNDNSITGGEDLTVKLSDVKSASDASGKDITLKFKASAKPYKMVSSSLPKTIYSFMPESADSTKAVFTFDGPIAQNPNIQLCYSPIDLGYEYTEPLEAVVEGNTITVDFAGKLRASDQMSALGAKLPSFDIRLYTIRDTRGQVVATETTGSVGSFRFQVPYVEIPRLNILSSFTPAAGAELADESDIKIYVNNADKLSFSGVKFVSGTDTVIVEKNNLTISNPSPAEVEISVAIPQGWNTKENVVVSLADLKTNDGYDHSTDVQAKYNGFVITFSDPANGAKVDRLTKDRTITIDSNLPAGVALSLSITDPDNNVIYGPASMTERSQGSYVHTVEKEIKFLSDNTYTIKFSTADGKTESIAIIGASVPYAYSDTEFSSISPADGSEVANAAEITVTFTGLASIEKAADSANFTAKPASEGETFDYQWILTLDPSESGMVNIIFSASDETGELIAGNQGEDAASHFMFTFSVTPGAIQAIEISPATNSIFDIQGRPLAKPVRGINIINGRKTLIR